MEQELEDPQNLVRVKGFQRNSRRELCFESYGVRVKISAEDDAIFDLGRSVAEKALVGKLRFFDNEIGPIDHEFDLFSLEDGSFGVTNNGSVFSQFPNETAFKRFLNSIIRIHVAEKANPWVFVHAGVVGWRGRAVVIPGQSYHGKSTLVSELIKLGAEYYSDEYAVFDEKGLIHPFERDLSIRKDRSSVPTEIHPDEFDAITGYKPLPVGLVFLTRFESGALWEPEHLSIGKCIVEMVPQVIPIKFSTKFSLKVLNTAFRHAIILRTLRGEARDAAKLILSLFDDALERGAI